MHQSKIDILFKILSEKYSIHKKQRSNSKCFEFDVKTGGRINLITLSDEKNPDYLKIEIYWGILGREKTEPFHMNSHKIPQNFLKRLDLFFETITNHT